MPDFEELRDALIRGDEKKVSHLVREMLNSGVSPEDILHKGLTTGMDEVGIRFKNCEMFIPEVLIAARAMTAGVQLIKPVMVKNTGQTKGKVMIGTVEGDLHDIGKNLVILMLESAGFQVIDLGKDVTPARFLEMYEKEQPSIIGMSTMLTTTLEKMRSTITLFEREGNRSEVKFIVGGAPVTEDFARKVGADGYAVDADESVRLVKRLVQ